MSFKPEEVSSVLAQELENYEAKLETKSVGTVLSRKPVRARPVPAQYVGTLVPGQGVQPWV